MITFWLFEDIARDLRNAWTWLRRDRVALANAQAHEQALTDRISRALHAEAERIAPDRRLDLYGQPWGGPWPADLCAYPPCQREDGWICVSHKPAPTGRHHAEVFTASDWKQFHDLLEEQ